MPIGNNNIYLISSRIFNQHGQFLCFLILAIIYKNKQVMFQGSDKLSFSCFSSSPSHSKKCSSSGTEADSQGLLIKKISLISCSSSISIEQHLSHSNERQLFAQFLFHYGTNKQPQFYSLMEKYYLQEIQFGNITPITFPNLHHDHNDLKGLIYNHFIGKWLLHMGYRTQNNKRMFVTRIRTHLGSDSLQRYTHIYNDFDRLELTKQQKFDLLMETCRNGWEYFIAAILRIDVENSHGCHNRMEHHKTHVINKLGLQTRGSF